jgi:hypothetical protein
MENDEKRDEKREKMFGDVFSLYVYEGGGKERRVVE